MIFILTFSCDYILVIPNPTSIKMFHTHISQTSSQIKIKCLNFYLANDCLIFVNNFRNSNITYTDNIQLFVINFWRGEGFHAYSQKLGLLKTRRNCSFLINDGMHYNIAQHVKIYAYRLIFRLYNKNSLWSFITIARNFAVRS